MSKEESKDENTDVGYFGSGIYFTNSARYAAEIYSDGNLLLAWVTMREPYPVVANAICNLPAKPTDMKKLEGYGAYQNYNAHYIPVVPIDPTHPKCAVYYPCAQSQEPVLDEIVVFQKSQALARFWIELEIDLPKTLGEPQTTVGLLLDKILDLLEKEEIQQDAEALQILETKSEMLIVLNPNQELSLPEQEFFRWILKLLDEAGKVRGFVRKKLMQPPSAPPSPATPHSPVQPHSPPAIQNNPTSPQVHPQPFQYQNPYPQPFQQPFSQNPYQQPLQPPFLQNPYQQPNPSPFPPIVNSPKPTQIQPIATPIQPKLPSIAFGKAKWAIHFGDIGHEPPLPPDIDKILSSPCPFFSSFWSNKKVEETHMLVLIPATVNGNPLTLKSLGELVKAPKQGNASKYEYLSLGEYKDTPTPRSYWALMTRDVLEGTRSKNYSDQKKIVEGFRQKTGIPYEVPNVLPTAVCLFMIHASTGKHLYGRDPWTYTRCQEAYNKDWQLVAGGFASPGLDVDYGYDVAIATLVLRVCGSFRFQE